MRNLIELQDSQMQALIIQKIEEEIRQRLAKKNGCKKKLKNILDRNFTKVLYKIFNNSKLRVKKYQYNSEFGCDEFGRDVKDGLNKYVKIIKSRGIKVHTVILLGSRSKGRWTPESDVDVTIIASNLPREGENFFTKRLFDLRRRVVLSDRPLYMRIEPSECCSKEEFIRRLKSFDIRALDAIFYGRIIYDDGFWKIVMDQYKNIERKYRLKNLPLRELLFPL